MEYKTPELRALGSFAGLTMGAGGSCPDGNGNNNQVGGGLDNNPGDPGTCGPSN